MLRDQIDLAAAQSPVTVTGDLAEKFSVMVRRLGGDVIQTDGSSLPATLTAATGGRDSTVAVSSDLTGLLPESLTHRGECPESWDVAITRGRLGVAATGSVLIAEITDTDRLLPILAREHIVLLPTGAIVQSLSEAAETLRALAASGVRYCTFVSGPSRTADIEKVLTIGAHGPGRLVIILVHEWLPRDDSTVP